MKLVFLDEAGTADNEPVAIVTGVIIDEQITEVIKQHLDDLRTRYLPESDRNGFIFHAMDIFNGKRYFSNRKDWDLQTRISLLKDLLSIPKIFELPVVIGHCSFVGDNPPIWKHIFSYFSAMSQVENYMLKFTTDVVKAQLIAEDIPSRKKFIKDTHDAFLSDQSTELNAHKLVAMNRIQGTVTFVKKEEQDLCQVADAIAYAVRRHLSGLPHAKELIEETIGNSTLINPGNQRGQYLFVANAAGAVQNRPISPGANYNAFLPID